MIVINPEKARAIAHDYRRAARAAEFEPHDAAIARAIPGVTETAELARQEIRARYDLFQQQIDAAESVEDLAALAIEARAVARGEIEAVRSGLAASSKDQSRGGEEQGNWDQMTGTTGLKPSVPISGFWSRVLRGG